MSKKIFLLCSMLLFVFSTAAFADVAAKVVVANPSGEKTETVPVKYFLPPEVEKEDILETNGLAVDYDVAKGAYFVYGELELAPKEVRTLKISMRDVWMIPKEQFDELRDVLEKKITASKEEVDIETLTLAGESAKKRIDALEKAQEEMAGNIEKRMQMYSFYMQKFDSIKTDVYSIDKIKELRPEEETEQLITLMIEAENSKDEAAELPVKYFLPKEILPQHVVETDTMSVKYDIDEDKFYLFKEESFAPKETKRYTIKIKNIWIISEKLINSYLREAGELKEGMVDTQYEEIAEILFKAIVDNAEKILSSQEKADSVKGYIAVYRENQKRLRDIEEDLQKLRNLNMKPSEEEESLSKSLQSMLEEIDYLAKLKQMINEFFKQKVRQGNVWKVIFVIVAFVIIMTGIFYGWWWLQNKKEGDVEFGEIKESAPGPPEEPETDAGSGPSEEEKKNG